MEAALEPTAWTGDPAAQTAGFDKLAVLVIAHANPGVFKSLAAALDHPDIDVFCHIDIKFDQAAFAVPASSNLKFISSRASIFWGGYTMIEAELALFREARAAGPYAAYVLISGDSLPLIDNAALVTLLKRVPHTLRFREQVPGEKSYERIERIYLPDTSLGAFSKPGSHLDRHLAVEDFVQVRRAMAVRRLKRSRDFRLFKGPQWFSVTDALLARMLTHLDADPTYEEIFRFSAIPDELFFHSLLKIVEPEEKNGFGIMAADWTRKPMPYVFKSKDDFDFVCASRGVFIRKFSDSCLGLVEDVLAGRLTADQVMATRGPAARYLRGRGRQAGEEAATDG